MDVGGSLYDVEFLDGTCVDLFTGCDDLSGFTFTDQAFAMGEPQDTDRLRSLAYRGQTDVETEIVRVLSTLALKAENFPYEPAPEFPPAP